jgi:putative Mg2+ transporter-C (MgtC) family protein
MPLNPEWSDIAIRLLCTLLAGGLIGYDRGEHGRPAGLRTTMLVSVAACLSMIQVNLLLPLAGKLPSSFVTMDPMRLPLGILSGMGFIGAGAIVRRDNLVLGVTTAATLWFVTVIGLCFGGGQIRLGLIGLVIGLVVLAGLRQVEAKMKQDRQGTLLIVTDPSGPGENDIRTTLLRAGFKIASCGAAYNSEAESQELNCALQRRAEANDSTVPAVVRMLAERPGVVKIAWTPQAR